MEAKKITVQKPRKLRNHQKSRGGCLRCRERKVKCSETRPACTNCVKAKCPCRYPLDPGVVTSISRPAILSGNRVNNGAILPPVPRSVPSAFSHNDLRAFHQYMTVAYPRLPLGAERAWKTDVPALSHEFSFCMHSLLALGLSHISFGEPLGTHRNEEAKHRALAIRGVNNLIAKDQWSATENDALLVTLYTLLFACSYAGDSIFDFFTLGRAAGNMTKRINSRPERSILLSGQGTAQDFIIGMKERLKPHHIDQGPVSEAQGSLDGLRSLEMKKPEQQLYGLLLQMTEMLRKSDTSAYFVISQAIQFTALLPPGEFEHMMNPLNPSVVAIHAHLIAFEAMMAPLMMTPDMLRGGRVNGRACGICVRHLWDDCPDARPFIVWPLQFCTAAEHRFKYGDPKFTKNGS